MTDVAEHYTRGEGLAARIAASLKQDGKDLAAITTADLGPVDEFHIRGRKATLELGEALLLGPTTRVLDLGSGLGGPARTLAETWGCHVTGIDLTPEFCRAADEMSGWVGLSDKVRFVQGDATVLPFEDNAFDAALTVHVAMNIAAKDKLYAEAHRVLKPGARFAVYDVMQGEGGDIIYPVPWARDASISFVATPDEVGELLVAAGFTRLERIDSTEESLNWFKDVAARIAQSGARASSSGIIFGEGFEEMVRNQVQNLTERRIRTVSFLCEA
jgi:ubiquinone/menaquinone biosynthesis C-methylase UbiE